MSPNWTGRGTGHYSTFSNSIYTESTDQVAAQRRSPRMEGHGRRCAAQRAGGVGGGGARHAGVQLVRAGQTPTASGAHETALQAL